MVHRLDLCKIVDGVAHQQCTGLWHIIGLVAIALIRTEQPAQLPAGGKAHEGIVFRLHAELLCMVRDELHRPAQILQGAVVADIPPDAIPQHKDAIAHLVQLCCHSNALVQVAAFHGRIAAHHQRIFAIGIRAGEPEQLHTAQRGVGCDLFRAVHLPGHLLTGFVILNDDVQAVGAVLCRGLTHIVQKGLVFIQAAQCKAVRIPFAIGGDPAARNGRVGADLLHGHIGGDAALRTHRQGKTSRKAQHDCTAFQQMSEHFTHSFPF